jgi:hypothetical protein
MQAKGSTMPINWEGMAQSPKTGIQYGFAPEDEWANVITSFPCNQ